MNILSLIAGKDYISLVKEFINKVFVHEEKKYKMEPGEVTIIITKSKNGNLQIISYDNRPDQNTHLRIIPDKEVQDILMK